VRQPDRWCKVRRPTKRSQAYGNIDYGGCPMTRYGSSGSGSSSSRPSHRRDNKGKVKKTSQAYWWYGSYFTLLDTYFV
ncbi:hypothetical protein PanWU01x14_320980, partial [Parasponia andersonii]